MLPWQLVQKDEGNSDTGKLRACLDATIQNKLLFRGENKMADVTTMAIKWRTAKYFISIDCEKMFWMIKVEANDQNLQHTLYRKNKEEDLEVYKHTVKVMGSTDSMSIARMVMLENASQHQEEYPNVKKIIEEDSYADDITLTGDSEIEVLNGTKNLITVIKKASFNAKKIVSDSKKLIEAFDEEVRHPIMNEIIKDREGGGTQKVLSQLGTKYIVNLSVNQSFLTYKHWGKGLIFDKKGFTKRNILSAVASCWSPLNEVGPLLTSGKLAVSILWRLQRFLAEKLKLAKEDLHPRKNFNPLMNQEGRPKEWARFQAKFPRIGWDCDLDKLDFSIMEERDSKEAGRRLGLVKELFTLFRENVEGLENKKIPRCNFSNLDFHKNGNIVEKKAFIFTDASGEKEEGCWDMWRI